MLRAVDVHVIYRSQIEQTIWQSIESHVKATVREWGESNETKRFVEGLENATQDNDVLIQDAAIKLENS